MKNLKKIMALVIAVAIVLALGSGAMAAQTYTITVDDGYKGETYTAYKIFDLTYSGTAPNVAYSYTITNTSATGEWFDDIVGNTVADTNGDYTLTTYGLKFQKTTTDGVYNVVDASTNNAPDADKMAALAAELAKHTAGKTANGTGKVDKEANDAYGAKADVTINVNPDEPGYYFVTTTTGALCALSTAAPSATVQEKNSLPSVDKKEKTSGDSYVDGPVDANIGDTVHYQIVITDGVGTDAGITLTDTLSTGLTYTAGSLKIDGNAVADDANVANKWKVTVSGNTITIEFAAAYIASLDANATITVTLDAVLNENAVVDDNDANGNEAKLDYSNQSNTDTIYVQTYDFQLYKTDGSKFLDGAGFKLYNAATGGTQIKLNKDSTGYYVDASSDVEILVDSENGVNVRGLAPGDYYLEETTVPGGYNPLAERQKVTISTNGTAAVEITVVNKSGNELPSTGGIGTTIFYVVGGILVLGAGVLLVTRKRMTVQ